MVCLQFRWTVTHILLIFDYYRSLGRNSWPKWLGNEFWLKSARDFHREIVEPLLVEFDPIFAIAIFFAGDGIIRRDKLGQTIFVRPVMQL